MEVKVPWWRWAFEFALSGIRSGFGLFRRNGRVEVVPETNAKAFVAEPVSSHEPESSFDPQNGPEPENERVELSAESGPKPANKESDVESIDEKLAEPERNTEPENTKIAPGQTRDSEPEVTEVESSIEKSAEPENKESEVESSAEIPADAEVEEIEWVAETSVIDEDVAPEVALSVPPAPAEVAPTEDVLAKVAPADLVAPEEEIALTKTSPQPEQAPVDPPKTESVSSPKEKAATEPLAAPAAEAPPPEQPSAPPAAQAVSATPPAPAAQAAAPQNSAPTLPFDPPLTAKPTAEPTTAEKVAAALKARGADAEQSPFSVFVGQVYDGPLDLLLDLIRKQDIDIYDIPIAKITAQFLAYVDHLRASDMDVAGEFIYTAALLIHIKSKMLLPRAPVGPEESAEDPRRELVDRLLEHERFRNAAQMLHDKQMLEANTWTNPGVREFREDAGAEPEIAADTTDLVRIFRDIIDRARNRPIINVEEDSVTVGQMIQFLTRRLTMEDKPVALRRLLSHTHSERALIAMFLALLELVRLQAILLRQDRQFSEIFVKKNSGFDAVMNEGLANARDDWR
jgi:segregation and condensation protein A